MPKRHTHRKIDHICQSHCNPPATSWSMSRGPRYLFGQPESSLSLSLSYFSLFLVTMTGLTNIIVVTAETVNTNMDNTQPLELYTRAS